MLLAQGQRSLGELQQHLNKIILTISYEQQADHQMLYFGLQNHNATTFSILIKNRHRTNLTQTVWLNATYRSSYFHPPAPHNTTQNLFSAEILKSHSFIIGIILK